MRWALDHLVIGAASLEQGAAWCEARLGVVPEPGGKHPLMGTHNRLLAIGSPAFPRAYLEIIAIDPDAPVPARRRWFDLDDAALQQRLAAAPALIHWVARCSDARAECAALASLGFDRGELLAAERPTPRGLLRWRIAVRPDGRRLGDGALPTLIEWGDTHPADTLPAGGLVLESLTLRGLPVALDDRLPAGVSRAASGAALSATLQTPRGPITLDSTP